MKSWTAVRPNGSHRRADITGTIRLSAPRYPAGARAGAAPPSTGQPALPGARQAAGPGPVPPAAPELCPFGVLNNQALSLRGARGVRPRYIRDGCAEPAKVPAAARWSR